MHIRGEKKAIVFSIGLAVGVLMAHLWLLCSFAPGWYTLLSFAVVCLSLSWAMENLNTAKSEPAALRRRPAALFHASSQKPRTTALKRGPLNAFTIDLEDYFHTEVASRVVPASDWDQMPSRIECSVLRLLDLLDEHGTQATVFTLGWVARNYPTLVREVARRGHEIACHSYRHQVVSRMAPQSFRADTIMAKSILEDVVGVRINGYRAPNFSITPGTEWAFQILEEEGFLYDSSVNPVWHKLYANQHAPRFPYLLPNTDLLEVPIATCRVAGINLPIGGGAYLRLLPYSYTRLGLAALNHLERKPATMYVHPWEIDRYQPVLSPDWKSRVRQTWGTSTMEDKLSRLLGSARFSSISEAYSQSFQVAPSVSSLPRHEENFAQVI